jgi:hypothetical protein
VFIHKEDTSMTKYHLDCSTDGCKETVLFVGVGSAGASRVKWLNGKKPCDTCKKSAYDAENTKAAEENQGAGLPALVGSEKQVAWAETIRAKRIAKMELYVQINETKNRDALATVINFHNAVVETMRKSDINKQDRLVASESTLLRETMDLIKMQSKASWWIDNQNDYEAGIEFAKSLIFKMQQNAEPDADETEDERAMRIEALAELTAFPEDPISKSPVIISINHASKKVIVRIDESCETAKRTMINSPFSTTITGGAYGPRSDYSTWELICNTEQYGEMRDRAAEICAQMLEAKIPVRVPDLDVRDLALSKTYNAYDKRWIAELQGGFVYIPHFRDDVLYLAIRRIKGSKWTSKGCMVPLSKYDDIEGFAQIYKYQITTQVRRLMADLKQANERAILVPESFKAAQSLSAMPDTPLSQTHVPDHIADDLRDE